MSLHTDGTHVYLASGTIWPGVIDPTLAKAYDVAVPHGIKINLAEHGEEDSPVMLPHRGTARDARMLASKLGDSHIFENNRVLTKHLYNPDEESIPNTKLLSVRDWRQG